MAALAAIKKKLKNFMTQDTEKDISCSHKFQNGSRWCTSIELFKDSKPLHLVIPPFPKTWESSEGELVPVADLHGNMNMEITWKMLYV